MRRLRGGGQSAACGITRGRGEKGERDGLPTKRTRRERTGLKRDRSLRDVGNLVIPIPGQRVRALQAPTIIDDDSGALAGSVAAAARGCFDPACLVCEHELKPASSRDMGCGGGGVAAGQVKDGLA